MAVGAILFAVIAATATVRLLLNRHPAKKSWKIAARSLGLAAMNIIGLMILAGYLAEHGAPTAGPDWLDWISVPWLGLILLGLVLLVRSRSRPANIAE
jgi:hypothetical protein